MKRPTDEILYEMAVQLGGADFRTPMSPDSLSKINKLRELNHANKLKGVMFQVLSSGQRYVVRQYVGGSMLTLAVMDGSDWIRLARVADMLTLRLGPNRLKNLHKVRENEMNFSLAQAEADFSNEPDVAAIIIGIEARLREQSLLFNPNVTQTTQKLNPIALRLDRIESKLDSIIQSLSPKV